MNEFTYKYLEANKIFNNIELIKNFGILEIGILIGLIIIFLISLYYIFPIIYIYYKYIMKNILKRKKLYFLKQIAIEKEIETKIQKEMESN